MFRENGSYKPLKKTVNVVLMNGGVGDHVSGSLVAISYMVKRYPWIEFLVWAPDFLVEFGRNVLPGVSIHGYSEMEAKGYNPDLPTKTTAWDGTVSPMKIHCADYAFLKLCDELPAVEHKNSLRVNFKPISIKQFNLPKKYVVLTTMSTVGVRAWPADSVYRVVSYVKSKGYTPVFVGQEKTPSGGAFTIEGKAAVDFSTGLNLVNRTSLLQVAKIMQGAAAVVGVDNGLLHVAACTDVSIVAGYTTVAPEIRAPIRADTVGLNWYPVVPDKSLGCRFCQSSTNFLYDVNYTKCMEKDVKCTLQLVAGKFIEHLYKIL